MTSLLETIIASTWGGFCEAFCSEGLAVGVCNTFAGFYDPLVKTICGILGGGK